MITTVTSVQRFATKTLYTRARATDGSTMLAPMSPGAGKGLRFLQDSISQILHKCSLFVHQLWALYGP